MPTTQRADDKPVKGDTWSWRSVTITVGEVDPKGQWAMIHCSVMPSQVGMLPSDKPVSPREWDKQQPLTDGRFPNDWIKVKGSNVQ